MANKQQDTQEQATYLGLIGLFATLFAAYATYRRRQDAETPLTPFDFALLGIATYRAGRLIAYDKVTEPLRAPFTETQPDESGAGEDVVAKGEGVQKAIGELIACPTCIGTWIGAVLVYGLGIAPGPTRTILAVVGTAGVAEVLDSLVELLTWNAQAARKQAGS